MFPIALAANSALLEINGLSVTCGGSVALWQRMGTPPSCLAQGNARTQVCGMAPEGTSGPRVHGKPRSVLTGPGVS